MATEYGVTSTGFVRKRLPEIRESIYTSLEEKLGASVARGSASMLGVLVDIFAAEIDLQWQIAEQDYYDRSPMTASDGAIDNTLAYTNVQRKQAEQTYLFAVCYGASGTDLPSNCQIRDGSHTYTINAESEISLNDCIHVTLSLAEPSEGLVYAVQFTDNTTIRYTAAADETATYIMTQLAGMEVSGWSGSVVDGKLVFEKTDRRYGSIVVPNENFTVVQVGTPVRFNCDEYGTIEPVLYAVNTINTVYDGWYSVSNESDAYVGRDYETVTEVRQRYASAVFIGTVGMKESIKAALLELEDVTAVTIYENRLDEYADGLKPHSFWCIVAGGDDNEIGKTIINVAPLGIDTNGDIELDVQDSEGTWERVYFSRPKYRPIYVQVLIKEYDEETLAGDTIDKIKEIVVEHINGLEMGKDVIYQRIIGPIYRGCDGIGYIDVTLSEDGETYSAENIPIARDEIASTEADNVYVALELW